MMKKTVLLSITASSFLLAGAYKIPEQSINSMALGAAYVAHTDGADTAYFNPANMAFMDDKQFAEVGLTWAHLPRNKFEGVAAGTSGKSEIENLQLPFMHYVANPIGNVRWGASLTVPGGLTKRWETPLQKAFAEEFTLKVVELNPVASYRVSDNFALGGGLRFIYSEGIVKNDARAVGKPAQREMEGDTIEFGYNLAMTLKPTSDINLAATYRSNIDLDEEGLANLYLMNVGNQYSAAVSVPLPAALNLAVSKTWNDKYTVELNYERTYWSAYETLDFKYGSPIQSQLVAPFDDPKAKNWKDTNTFRIGFTGKMSDKLTLMAGYTKDETPIDKQHISYELPDSDANIYTFGFRIQHSKELSYGMAYLHDEKESFSVAQGAGEVNGKFSGGGADLLSVGVAYTF